MSNKFIRSLEKILDVEANKHGVQYSLTTGGKHRKIILSYNDKERRIAFSSNGAENEMKCIMRQLVKYINDLKV